MAAHGGTTARKSGMVTTTMRERAAERNGPRRTVYGIEHKTRSDEDRLATPEPDNFPFRSGGAYVGEWVANQKHGFGTQNWTDGRKYEGEWVDGQRNGKGTLWLAEGPKSRLRKQYAGDWRNGKRHGDGVFMFKNGDRFEGQWCEGQRHGQGRMTYAAALDGSGGGSSSSSSSSGGGPQEPVPVWYDGGWANDKRSGLGVLAFANGNRFEGHWLEDKKEGPGRFFYRSTNKVYEGEWVSDVPKCGEFKDAPFGSFDDEPVPDPALAIDVPFKLPSLGLLQSERVLSESVVKVRQARARDVNAPGLASFGDTDLDVLKKGFDSLDVRGTGFLSCGDIGTLLEVVQVNVPVEVIEDLLLSLEVDPSTPLSFSEFVDMAALLMEHQV